MHFKRLRLRLAAVAAAVGIGITGAALAVPQAANAATNTTCTTLTLRYPGVDLSSVRPHMQVPVCYNGSQIWVNGGVTPGYSLYGWTSSGFTWFGTYNDSSKTWLGVGENYPISMWPTSIVTLACSTRWILNASGNVTSYTKGC